MAHWFRVAFLCTPLVGGGAETAAGTPGLSGAGGNQAAGEATADHCLKGGCKERDKQNYEITKKGPQKERGEISFGEGLPL